MKRHLTRAHSISNMDALFRLKVGVVVELYSSSVIEFADPVLLFEKNVG